MFVKSIRLCVYKYMMKYLKYVKSMPRRIRRDSLLDSVGT